jgi:hypothetical protein
VPPRPSWPTTPATGALRPAGLARSLPGLATIGGLPWPPPWQGQSLRQRQQVPLLHRPTPSVGDRQHRPQGQPISKAGNRLLRTTLHRAADHARRQDPQLTRIYHTQMVQRGNGHLGAVCVVAAHLAERAWTVMDRGTPYVVCDTDGTPVTPAKAKAIIADHWTVPEQVRQRRRSKKGRPLNKSSPDMCMALTAQRGDPPLLGHAWPTTQPRQADPASTLTAKPP